MDDPNFRESLNDWEMVLARENKNKNKSKTTVKEDFSIFPPSKHEGLQIPLPSPPPTPQQLESVTDTPTQPSSSEETEQPDSRRKVVASERGKFLRYWFGWIIRKVHHYHAICGGGFWSFKLVTLVIAAVVYKRVHRWFQFLREDRKNNALTLLVNERDQKISQLLLQIAQMNVTCYRRAAEFQLSELIDYQTNFFSWCCLFNTSFYYILCAVVYVQKRPTIL